MTVKMAAEGSNLAATGVLLIAHGSRYESANDDTRALAAGIVDRQSFRIAVAAFMEIAQPDIDAGAAECVRLGATRVIMLPHFLSAGMHVRDDLLAAKDRLEGRFPDVSFRLAAPLGQHPLMLDLLIDRAFEMIR
jgi:sirohydrochlorin ferrochelatase